MKLQWRLEKVLKGAYEITAQAKINWTLDIVGQREDGYHLLDSLMQPLALCDTIFIEPAEELSLEIRGAELKADESNLVLRAARALQEKTGTAKGAHISLWKEIPMGAGLGGGSADAAAALRGLCEFWELDLTEDALYEMGLKLGADVPFCLMNSPARARGIGEKLTPIHVEKTYPLVLLQPCGPLSTKAVFEAYHQLPARPSDVNACLEALAKGDLKKLSENAVNALEGVSMDMRPEIKRAKEALRENGAAFAQMTGSGSVVIGAFEKHRDARKAYETLKKQYACCILTETAL